MHFAILTPNKTIREKCQRALSQIVPEARIQSEPSFSNPETVTAVLVWRHPPRSLQQFQNLKFIFSMGAGVDHIFEDEQIPKDSPIWHHPKIKMTPHIASITTPSEGAHQFVENYKRLQKDCPF